MLLEPGDWLSRLLDLVPVSGQVEHRCLFGMPWRLETEASEAGEMPYHIVLAGTATLNDLAGFPPLRLTAGDILLLPQGAAHILHDGSGAPPAAMWQRHGSTVTIDENEGTGERLDMLCGRFTLSPTHERLLRLYFPERLVIRTTCDGDENAATDTRSRLSGLVSLIRAESAETNLGGQAMLRGLSTALFTLTMRLASEATDAAPGLLALAAHPRLTPALTALFHQPERDWTIPDLADLCSMSRATFIRHFQQRLGRSATELLTDVRMTVAARLLRASDASTEAVAAAVGYHSEAAFQRAFRRHVGTTPAQYRRQVT